MPYNTTAIPPKKEPTGQAQLPLSRIKRIIAQDQDISICSNNAAFVITMAAEMFIQHLSEEAHHQVKIDPKPRRNMQYKDVANAVARQERLEFLEDVVPKTIPYRNIKAHSAETQSRLKTVNTAGGGDEVVMGRPRTATNGSTTTSIVNGDSTFGMLTSPRALNSTPTHPASVAALVSEEDPSQQLELEMRQANGQRGHDGDVHMSG